MEKSKIILCILLWPNQWDTNLFEGSFCPTHCPAAHISTMRTVENIMIHPSVYAQSR